MAVRSLASRPYASSFGRPIHAGPPPAGPVDRKKGPVTTHVRLRSEVRPPHRLPYDEGPARTTLAEPGRSRLRRLLPRLSAQRGTLAPGPTRGSTGSAYLQRPMDRPILVPSQRPLWFEMTTFFAVISLSYRSELRRDQGKTSFLIVRRLPTDGSNSARAFGERQRRKPQGSGVNLTTCPFAHRAASWRVLPCGWGRELCPFARPDVVEIRTRIGSGRKDGNLVSSRGTGKIAKTGDRCPTPTARPVERVGASRVGRRRPPAGVDGRKIPNAPPTRFSRARRAGIPLEPMG